MESTLIAGYRSPRAMTVEDLLHLLPQLLGSLFIDERCLIAVAEFDDGRYVQFWAEGGVSLVAEVIANQGSTSSRVLSDADERHLMTRGWSGPGPLGPNWRYEARNVAQVIECVAMVRDAIRSVLRQGDDVTVSLRSWTMVRDACVDGVVAREQGRNAYRRSLEELRRQIDGDEVT